LKNLNFLKSETYYYFDPLFDTQILFFKMSLFQAAPMDFETTWRVLESQLRPILSDIGAGLNSDTWMELYTAVYKLCSNPTNPKHRELYFHLRDLLIDFTCTFCEELRQMADQLPPSDVFLKRYCKGFEQYSIGMKYSADMFSYLDRYWIRENHFDIGENPTEHVYYVWELALHMWREQVYNRMSGKIRKSVLDMLDQSRKKRTLSLQNADILKRLMQTYVLLGFENRERSELFRTELEEAMVRDAEEYYKAMGSDLLQYLHVSEYLIEIEKLIDEEEVRCRRCLNRESVRRIRKAVETALIVFPLDRVLEEARAMLQERPEKVEDLRRMYTLMRDVSEDGIKSLQDVVRDHIQAEGLKVVKGLDIKAAWSDDKSDSVTMPPDQVMNCILDVYWRHHSLVKEAFPDSKDFLEVLDQGSRVFVNAIDGAPEMLARFSHKILDRTSPSSRMAEDARQEALGRVAFLFKFVGDKDVFHKIYTRLLAVRLAEETSVSDEAEEMMLEKLKEYAGFEFISSLQRMFIDKSMSAELNREYQGWLNGILPGNSSLIGTMSNTMDLNISLSGQGSGRSGSAKVSKKKTILSRFGIGKKKGDKSPKSDRKSNSTAEDRASPVGPGCKPRVEGYSFILTAGCWPVKAKELTMRIPLIIQDYITSFTTFYNETYCGRRLKYLYHLGHAEVLAKCFKSKYFLVVSTYQMFILYEFNQSESLSLSALSQTCKMEPPEMARQLFPLLKMKVLSIRGASSSPSSPDSINEGDIIQVNSNFQNKRTRLKIPAPPEAKKAAKEKNLEIREELIADRKMVTQAAIVRIMKARKTISHNALIADVTTQVSKLYVADVKFIKKQIEDLIEKDYLEREDNSDAYSYVD